MTSRTKVNLVAEHHSESGSSAYQQFLPHKKSVAGKLNWQVYDSTLKPSFTSQPSPGSPPVGSLEPKGGIQSKKEKKMQKILHLGFLIPPPECRKIQPIFLKLLASFWATLEKFIFSPWKSPKKKLRIFSENWSSEGAWPPSQREKFFFAFLDELDHSTHFLKNAENWPSSDPPSPPS